MSGKNSLLAVLLNTAGAARYLHRNVIHRAACEGVSPPKGVLASRAMRMTKHVPFFSSARDKPVIRSKGEGNKMHLDSLFYTHHWCSVICVYRLEHMSFENQAHTATLLEGARSPSCNYSLLIGALTGKGDY